MSYDDNFFNLQPSSFPVPEPALPNAWGSAFDNTLAGITSPWMNPGVTAAPSASTASSWFTDPKLWGGIGPDGQKMGGMIPTGIQAISGLADAWLGFQQLNLGRDSLDFQKSAFNKNFENQRTLTNSRLRDRQAARLGASPGGYESIESYMSKNGV